jgi:hypothetical protein
MEVVRVAEALPWTRDKFKGLPFLEFIEDFLLGQILGAIETLATLAATIGAIGQEE